MSNLKENSVSANFGYYPRDFSISNERFSVETLPNFNEILMIINNDPNVHKHWIYPGPAQQNNFASGKLYFLPYNSRIFGLPKTHKLTLYKSDNLEDLDFVVWCLSFFTGMRLTITERGFLDATPIKPGKLVDFTLVNCNLENVIDLALIYLESEHNNIRSFSRVKAVIHCLFLAQYPQSLDFEKFQYLYIALDTCYKIISTKSKPLKKVNHTDRIKWMCQQFDMPVPDWAEIINNKSEISIVRNDSFHEALFFDQPLGFSIYGGNEIDGNRKNIILQIEHLICRLLVAILGGNEIEYVKTGVDSRQILPLILNNLKNNS